MLLNLLTILILFFNCLKLDNRYTVGWLADPALYQTNLNLRIKIQPVTDAADTRANHVFMNKKGEGWSSNMIILHFYT